MSALADHLDRLLQWLKNIGLEPPAREVRIVELRPDDFDQADGRHHIVIERLREPSQYANRFDDLLRVGYVWLNMSCYGIHDDLLIVAIEAPSDTVPLWTASGWSEQPRELHPGCATSVNLSGPTRAVIDHEWNVDSILVVE